MCFSSKLSAPVSNYTFITDVTSFSMTSVGKMAEYMREMVSSKYVTGRIYEYKKEIQCLYDRHKKCIRFFSFHYQTCGRKNTSCIVKQQIIAVTESLKMFWFKIPKTVR